ncbi:MAG: YdcF family protein [Gemmatimonadaceae bacterium]
MTSDSTIYETQRGQTSEVSSRRDILLRACVGLALGGSVWMFLVTLGIADVFHLARMSLIIPFGLIGAQLALTRFRSALAVVAAAALLFLFLVAYSPLFIGPALSFVRRDRLPTSADAVVVLSAGVTRDGYLKQQGLDRLLTGLSLMRHGVAPTLVVTREERDLGDRKITAVRDQNSLAALAGVTQILNTPPEASTHDEAMAVRKIADASGWNRIVLVTSPFHTKRACATFEKAGLITSCIPADSRDIAVKSLDHPDERIEAFRMWIYETAATLQYRRRGWI